MTVTLRCQDCGERMRGDPDAIGARCPRCRMPLYEDPRRARGSDRAPAAGSRCVLHADNEALGTCQRCGNFLCAVCRTRWQNQALCIACAERALQDHEATPAETRAHFRQAVLGVIFGVAAWAGTILAGLMFAAGTSGKTVNPGLVGLGVLMLLATPLPSLLGIGQGAAAIRAHGDHMILATIGLLLSGVHIGTLIGFFSLALFQKN